MNGPLLGSVCYSLVRMSESIGFCCMHYTVGMFWRRINREKFQSFIPSVSEIMFRSGWHGKHLARADVMRLRSYDGLARAFHKIQNLVNSFVDFPANVFSRKDAQWESLPTDPLKYYSGRLFGTDKSTVARLSEGKL